MRNLVPVLLIAAPLLAQAPIPNTPAGQKLKAWLENFNAGDAARIAKFAKENYSAKMLERFPPEKCGEMDTSVHANLGELHVHSVEVPAENAIKALLTNKEQAAWMEISFSVTPEAPHTMNGLRIGPGQRPVALTPEPKSNSAHGTVIPSTPVGQKLKAWLENFNAGDAARIEQYARENYSAEVLKETPAEQFAKLETGGRKQVGELRLHSVDVVDGHRLKAKLANKSEDIWLQVELSVSPDAPHRVTALDVGPTKSPIAARNAAPATKLTPALRAEVLESILKGLANTYIDTEAAPAISEHLKARLKAGAYDKLENPSQFAEVITQDLRKINGDLHLSLQFSATSAPSRLSGPEPLSQVRRTNFGLGRAEILPGNVGYLEVTGFEDGEGFEEAMADALRFLSRTDALIIDLRRNPGGSSNYSHLLFSHFMGETPVPTIQVRSRHSAKPDLRHSLAKVPGPRRPDVPLFLLTSQGTGSAAEEFSFVLKNKRRATLVGTRTGGAGRMVRGLPIGHGFTFGVSITQVTDPETGREWEQVGVLPDMDVPAEKALAEAHAAALKRILTGTKDAGQVTRLNRVIESVEASGRAPSLDARGLARFAGVYEGREVAVKEGRLTYGRRQGALGQELIHLSGNRFALGQSAIQIVFEEKDGKTSLTLENPDGTHVTFPRKKTS